MADTKDIGAHDAKFTDKVGDMAEAAAAAVSHKIHPMIEQYAQLFTHGARTFAAAMAVA